MAKLTYLCIDSGHGGQTKDSDGDEADGFDETIYPADFKVAGHIVDDVSSFRQFSTYYIALMLCSQEMHSIMVKPLPPGCRLTAIFDVSHCRG